MTTDRWTLDCGRDSPAPAAASAASPSRSSTESQATSTASGFDVVDALTGPAIGRAKSATYRTADVVGLDTMAHVIKTLLALAKRSGDRPPVVAAIALVLLGIGAGRDLGSSRRAMGWTLAAGVATVRLPPAADPWTAARRRRSATARPTRS